MTIKWYSPRKWQPKAMPHFEATLRRIGRNGPCFFRAAAFVLDVPQARLMVATFRPGTPEEIARDRNVSDEPFIHCWAEVGGSVYAPTSYENCHNQLVPFNLVDYYEGNGAKDVVCMTRANLMRLSKKYGLGKHLLYLTPLEGNLKFASIILDELGVKHRLSKDNGLIPGD